ncbi:10176_t:CDS:2, partial [Gigaspora rosea]
MNDNIQIDFANAITILSHADIQLSTNLTTFVFQQTYKVHPFKHNLISADLTSACLQNAKIFKYESSKGRLQSANFQNAKLQNADLQNSNFNMQISQ